MGFLGCQLAVQLKWGNCDRNQRQWAACHPDGFAPRFETTRNWARQLAPFSPGPDDLSFDPARDLPLAQNLLERAGLGAQRDVLAGALVESATQLAALAAAHAPRRAPGLGRRDDAGGGQR
jgi:ATP-dependent helicase/nuclease subunit B